MQRLIPILVCLLTLPLLADAPLTNDDVITMVHAGISTDVIIEKIKTSPTAFTTTTPALVQLAEAKVPEAVIKLMIASTTTPAPAPAAAPATPGAVTTTAPARVILQGTEFWINGTGYRGDLVVDHRGLTFCCARILQVPFLRCAMSFHIPLATITTAYVMGDPKKMPGLHIVDVAHQGYYFVTKYFGREQGDAILAAFPQAIENLLALKPSIVREDHSWKDQKAVIRSYTIAAVTGGNYCDTDYAIMKGE